MKKIKNGA